MSLLALLDVVRLEFIDLALLLEIENGDRGGCGGAEPISVGREDKSMDLITGLEGIEVLRLVEIPQHSGTVLAAGSAERTIGGDCYGIDVARMADVIGLDSARGELPHL